MKTFFAALFFCLCSISGFAQLERVKVEAYYLSDSLDATDTTGGNLPKGSFTYRVYIGMKPGSVLKKVYGDAFHALRFSSTQTFFNNKADGVTFAHELNKNRYFDNTVALDTWLALGQASTTGTRTYFGIPKSLDVDGSIVGGANNDGGSEGISQGLLTHNDPWAGIPITQADGLDTLVSTPDGWADVGFRDFLTLSDSTMFGSIVSQSSFESWNASLQNSGVKGVLLDSNYVLVGQFTTKGDFRFELNVVVGFPDGQDFRNVHYVANGDTLLPDEVLHPQLTYPLVCGCLDPRFVEYKPSFGCDAPDSCLNLIRFGCTDTAACNYDPSANRNVSSMCCYPGLCQDRNLDQVCLSGTDAPVELNVYPVPADLQVEVALNARQDGGAVVKIMDTVGATLKGDVSISLVKGRNTWIVDTSGLPSGLLIMEVSFNGSVIRKLFPKL
jgi:hypothetical protein